MKKPKDLLMLIIVLLVGVVLGLQVKVVSANTLYTSKTCPHCEIAKDGLHYYCISFREVRIEKENPYSIKAVPVLKTVVGKLITGDTLIVQYAKENKKCH